MIVMMIEMMVMMIDVRDDGDDDGAHSLASSVYIFGVTTHIHCDRDDDSGED
jgi:hypothetical protein